MKLVVYGWGTTVVERHINTYCTPCLTDQECVLLGDNTNFFQKVSFEGSLMFTAFSKFEIKSIVNASCGANIMIWSSSNGDIVLLDGTSQIPRTIHNVNKVIKIACGDNHALISAAMNSGSTLFACGRNKHGELGLGENISFSETLQSVTLPIDEYPIDIAGGTNHSLVATGPYGKVYSFGCGAYYRLGHGDEANRYVPTLVSALEGVGILNPTTGVTSGCRMVAAGRWHSLAVAQGSDDVYGWGWNTAGQLGGGTTTRQNYEAELVIECRRLVGLDDFLESDSETGSSDESVVMNISCGVNHSAILTRKGSVIVMGGLDFINHSESILKATNKSELHCRILPISGTAVAVTSSLHSLGVIVR